MVDLSSLHAHDRTVCLDDDTPSLAPCSYLPLLAERMSFDLIHGRQFQASFNQLFEMPHTKVADTDATNFPSVSSFYQGAICGETSIAFRPRIVNEIEVDISRLQLLERRINCSECLIVALPGCLDLAC